MKFLIITFVALSTLLFTYGAYTMFFRKKDHKPMGFLDYVRDPTSRDTLNATFRDRDATINKLANESPEVLVAMLLDEPDSSGIPSKAIEAAGARIVPALLSAVVDPRFREEKREGVFGIEVEPLEGVLRCLSHFAPTEAIPLVLPLVQDENKSIRKQVAHLLGAIGTDETIIPLGQLLQDENEYVRSNAIRGIQLAVDFNRVTDSFRDSIFDSIYEATFAKQVPGFDDVPCCLLSLDRSRAIDALTSAESLRPDRANLQYVLHALRVAQAHIDEEHLHTVLSELEELAVRYPKDRIVGEALKLLAVGNPESAKLWINRFETHSSQDVREFAAEAHLIVHGLSDPWESSWKKRELGGWQSLSQSQQHALGVRILVDEVNNGGFLQYFFNSSGDHWRDAYEGLQAIGAEGDCLLFERVLNSFHANLPSDDQDERHRQIAQIAKSSDDPFRDIETKFYEDANDREVLLLKYILNHVDEFK